jgi:hypothetical protein
MKDIWKRVSGVVLSTVMAFGMIAPGLQASPSEAGSFKLPFDVQLGSKMALPTGDYTFSIDRSASSYGTILVYRGTQAVGMALPQRLERNEKPGEKPALVCIRHDGKVTVRALRLPNVGTFYFSLPNDLKMLAAQQPQLIETVSIQVTGE